ncbi:hypothetical protein ANAPC5_01385 [Anaplasma phagocytophilum]|nr:hypothetical protein ANAPC5_01385 [Anaplasma phagocytophilum]
MTPRDDITRTFLAGGFLQVAFFRCDSLNTAVPKVSKIALMMQKFYILLKDVTNNFSQSTSFASDAIAGY